MTCIFPWSHWLLLALKDALDRTLSTKPMRSGIWAFFAISLAPSSAMSNEATRTIAVDCGDNRAIVKTETPDTANGKPDDDSIDWLALSQRARYGDDAPEPPKEDTAPGASETEGCILAERSTDIDEMSDFEDLQAFVVKTDMMAPENTSTRTTSENSASASLENDGVGLKTISEKPGWLPTREDDSLDIAAIAKAVAIILGVLLLVVSAIFYKHVRGIFMGWYLRRRTCRVAASLVSDKASFPGEVLILGKLGCRFVPSEWDSLHRLMEFLDDDSIHYFDINIAGNKRPVFVDRVEGNTVAIFFVEPLTRRESRQILGQSADPVKFSVWWPVVSDKVQLRKEVIQQRLANLQALREEEIRSRKLAGLLKLKSQKRA